MCTVRVWSQHVKTEFFQSCMLSFGGGKLNAFSSVQHAAFTYSVLAFCDAQQHGPLEAASRRHPCVLTCAVKTQPGRSFFHGFLMADM